jgi:hypothetical protein
LQLKGVAMSKWSFKNNLKATVVTPLGLTHLVLTSAIIIAAALINDTQITLKIIIVAATVLAYFIANVDFRKKGENLKKIK